MKYINFLLQITLFASIATLNVKLDLVQYQPVIFKLSFSQPIQRPDFQILLNNQQDLRYKIITNETISDCFYIQLQSYQLQTSTNLQTYELIFNYPFRIGEGKLPLQSFTITAEKQGMAIQISNMFGILIVVVAYILSNFTLLGHVIIEYTQIYILFAFKNKMKTTIYKQLAQGMLLLPPAQVIGSSSFSLKILPLLCLFIPFLIILTLGVIGFIMKRCMTRKRSICMNIIYETFTYNSFVNVSTIFIFNLVFNSIQFITLATKSAAVLSETTIKLGYTLIYFNLIMALALYYLMIYILNPKLCESNQSWQKYKNSGQFEQFRKLHEGVYLNVWFKRNKTIIRLTKKILIAIFFFTSSFEYMTIIFQFITIYYVFTTRPYKDQFMVNSYVICRLLLIVTYIMMVLTNLYYSLGSITMNYGQAKSLIMSRDVIFIIFVGIMVVIICFQIFQKCSNLNYQIRLVKEENQYKLKIIQHKDQHTPNNRKHHTTVFSNGSSHKQNDKKNAHHQEEELSAIFKSSPRERQTTFFSSGSPEFQSQIGKKRQTIFGIELLKINQNTNTKDKIVSREQKAIEEERQVRKKYKKWRQENVLQGILNAK